MNMSDVPAVNGTSAPWDEDLVGHGLCAIRVRALARRLRACQAALRVLAELTDDPKTAHLALRTLQDTKW